MINPMQLMQLKSKFADLTRRHPKAAAFVQTVIVPGLPEGTVIEMTVRKPGEEPMTANVRVLAEDIALFEELKNMQS